MTRWASFGVLISTTAHLIQPLALVSRFYLATIVDVDSSSVGGAHPLAEPSPNVPLGTEEKCEHETTGLTPSFASCLLKKEGECSYSVARRPFDKFGREGHMSFSKEVFLEKFEM